MKAERLEFLPGGAKGIRRSRRREEADGTGVGHGPPPYVGYRLSALQSACKLFGLTFLFLLTGIASAAPDVSKLPTPAQRPVDFVKDIRPIFEATCYKCHGPDKQQGEFRLDVKAAAFKGGEHHAPDIVPGKSADSPLIHFVAGLVPDMQMPAKGDPLTAGQIGLLRAWIDQGAPWPDGIDTVQAKDKADPWAFKPVSRPAVPPVKKADWPRNEIDHFILNELERERLTPSPEADRRTLIRRLYFNLIGLPPTPTEVDAFIQDRDSDAYEKLVDRLLASPHYGERWARHWLDVIAFGETHGFEVNTPRDHAWPYRDYVIRAFNEDKPYPAFIKDQLAGDATGEDAATGFIVAKAALLPGQIGRDLESILLARQDELNDMVLGAGATFLGLTINCARCHDHKFDPISQRDYYAMTALFAGVRHGERPLPSADDVERKREAERLQPRLAEIDLQLVRFEPLANPARPEPKPTNAKLNEEAFDAVEAKFVRFTIHDANLHPTLGLIEPCIDELEIFSMDNRNVALAGAGAKVTASSSAKGSDLHRLEHINDGKYGNSHSWMSDERGRGQVLVELYDQTLINKIVWSRDRAGQYTDRLATAFLIEAGPSLAAMTKVAGQPASRPAVSPRLSVDRFPPVAAKRLRFTVLATTSLEPCLDELEVFTAGPQPGNVALASAGARTKASGTISSSDIHRLEFINDGRYGNGRSWISSEAGQGWVEVEFPQTATIDRVVWGRDREEKFTDRLATNYKIEVADDSGSWRLVASSADRRKYVAGENPQPTYSAEGLTQAGQKELDQLLDERRT
ncbi:MAG: DUF1549 domain-containing protein, partial [Chloroflexi bacterium]|nr:DUF1549 domain-containing protein [Chloroflexota bacterium]